MKNCSKCNVSKSEDSFYCRSNGNLRADCKECFKLRVSIKAKTRSAEISNCKKIHYIKNRDTIRFERKKLRDEKKKIIEAAKNNSCLDCGNFFPSCAMDFDHRDRSEKKLEISKILNTNFSVNVLLFELEKCDLVCACCHRIRTQNFIENNKINKRAYPSRKAKKYFIDSLKNKPCVDCNGSFQPYQMDFDHIIGEKRFNISRSVDMSCTNEEIFEEIKKCELVCVNCHRIRTQERKIWLLNKY